MFTLFCLLHTSYSDVQSINLLQFFYHNICFDNSIGMYICVKVYKWITQKKILGEPRIVSYKHMKWLCK